MYRRNKYITSLVERKQAMRKAALLLTFTALVAGCTNTGPGSPGDPCAAPVARNHWITPSPVSMSSTSARKAMTETSIAKTYLPLMYEQHGCAADIPKARALFQSIANVDEAGYHNLGRMAEEGIGETSDYVKARALYQRSISVSDSK